MELMEKLDEKKKSGSEQQYLTFQLSEEELGINILRIKEIISYESIAHIPLMPNYVKGVMNVRGNVKTVCEKKYKSYRDICIRG